MSMQSRRVVLQGLAASGVVVPHRVGAAGRPAFLALGDWGRQGDPGQVAVAAAMAQAARQVASRFVISVGDNFYPAGVKSASDPQWRSSFEAVYGEPSLQTPWYAALGNHDHRGSPDAQIAYSRRAGRWRMPSRYYSIQGQALGIPGLDLFVLDTTPMLTMNGELLAEIVPLDFPLPGRVEQLRWLDASLSSSQAAWKVVVGHHPIRSGGHHGSSHELIYHLEPLLERHGVQLYLSGHDHDLQHIRVGRLDHVVTGSGASAGPTSAIDGTRYAASARGFAVFSLDGDEMEVAFRNSDGATLYRTALPRRRV